MPTQILSVAEIKEHIETGLGEGALKRIIDAETAEIERRFGVVATATELIASKDDEYVILQQKRVTITSVTETVDDTSTVLSADDYRVWNGAMLQRLDDGTNPRSLWGDRVSVVYVPEDRSDQRALVLVQLVTLAIEYKGLKTEDVGSGDYRMTALEYNVERENLLRSLRHRGFVCA
jgi:hypothetical protein